MAAGRSPAQIEHGRKARKRPGSRGQPQADTGAGPSSASAPTARSGIAAARASIGPVLRLAERPTAAAPDHVARSPRPVLRSRDAAASRVEATGNAAVCRPFGGSKALRYSEMHPSCSRALGRLPWAPIWIRLTPSAEMSASSSAATEEVPDMRAIKLWPLGAAILLAGGAVQAADPLSDRPVLRMSAGPTSPRPPPATSVVLEPRL